jgi:hypothetical protein
MILWMAWQMAFDADAAVERYKQETRATIECDASKPDDIVICGHREADRYRVPFVTIDRDDPRNEAVAAERERLLARTNNCQELSTFLVGCGKVGVGVSSQHGVTLGGERPIAP